MVDFWWLLGLVVLALIPFLCLLGIVSGLITILFTWRSIVRERRVVPLSEAPPSRWDWWGEVHGDGPGQRAGRGDRTESERSGGRGGV